MDSRRIGIFSVFLFFLAFPSFAQISSDVKDIQVARQQLRVGLDTSRYVRSITQAITSGSTHREMPTAKAVYDYGQSLTFTLVTTPTLTGAGTSGSPLTIAQQGATNGQPLEWNSSLGRWAPGTDDTGGAAAVRPAQQIIYGTGTGIWSRSNFVLDTANMRVGIQNSSPLAPLHVGSNNSNPSSTTLILASENWTNTAVFGHAFTDGSDVRNGKSYGAFDGRFTIHNSILGVGGHAVAFQATPTVVEGITVQELFPVYSGPVNNGTVNVLPYIKVQGGLGTGNSGLAYGLQINNIINTAQGYGVNISNVTGTNPRGIAISGVSGAGARGIEILNPSGTNARAGYFQGLTEFNSTSSSGNVEHVEFSRPSLGSGDRQGFSFQAAGYYFGGIYAKEAGGLKGDLMFFTNPTGGVGIGNLVNNFIMKNTGIFDAQTGFSVNGAAVAKKYLRGDGTKFTSSDLLPSDLAAEGAANGNILAYNSSLARWVPSAASGGNLSGSGNAGQVAHFTGTNTLASYSNMLYDNTAKRLILNSDGDNNAREVLRLVKSGGWTETSVYNYANASPARRGIRIGASPDFAAIGDKANTIALDHRQGYTGFNLNFPNFRAHLGNLGDANGLMLDRDTAGTTGALIQVNSEGDLVFRNTTGRFSIGPLSGSIGTYNPAAPVHIYAPTGGTGSDVIYRAERSGGAGYSYWKQYYNSFSDFGLIFGGLAQGGASDNDVLTIRSSTDEAEVTGSLKVTNRTGTATALGGFDSANKVVDVPLGSGLGLVSGTLTNTGDLSNTNEIQRIDTLSVVGNTLRVSLLNDGVPFSSVALPVVAPGGSTNQIQYNNGGAFAGSPNFTVGTENINISGGLPGLNLNATTNSSGYGITYQFNNAGRFRFAYQENVSRFFIQGTDGSGNFTINPGLSINRGGNSNVGINVAVGTSPTQPLHVNGNMRVDGAIMPNNLAGTSGQVLKSQGAGVAPVWGVTDNIYTSDGTFTGSRGATIGSFTLTFDASASTSAAAIPLAVKGKADASNSTQILTAIDATNITRGFVNMTNTKYAFTAANGHDAAVESGSQSWTFSPSAWLRLPGTAVNPTLTTGNSGAIWWNSTDARVRYNPSSSARTVANLEDDISGSTNDFTTGFTVTGTQYAPVANANGGNIAVTVDANMREGFTYFLRAANNGTNTVTVTPAVGFTITVDGTSGNPANYVLTAHEVVRLTRYSTNIIIDK